MTTKKKCHGCDITEDQINMIYELLLRKINKQIFQNTHHGVYCVSQSNIQTCNERKTYGGYKYGVIDILYNSHNVKGILGVYTAPLCGSLIRSFQKNNKRNRKNKCTTDRLKYIFFKQDEKTLTQKKKENKCSENKGIHGAKTLKTRETCPLTKNYKL
jgi:hypothetical protein